MTIDFDPETHTYAIDSRPVPSVTRLLEDEGCYYNPFAMDHHRNRGTLVHQICDLIDGRPWEASSVENLIAQSQWDPAGTDPILVPYGMAYADFLVKTQFHAALSEKVVGSAMFGYAGKLDKHGYVGAESWLVDVKSGKPGPSAKLQTALYAHGLEEHLGIPTDKRLTVWLQDDGDFKMEFGNGGDLDVALAVVKVWHWRRSNKLFT